MGDATLAVGGSQGAVVRQVKRGPVLSAIRRLSGLDAMRATHAVSVCKARVQGQHPWACLRGGARKSVFGVLQGVQGLCP